MLAAERQISSQVVRGRRAGYRPVLRSSWAIGWRSAPLCLLHGTYGRFVGEGSKLTHWIGLSWLCVFFYWFWISGLAGCIYSDNPMERPLTTIRYLSELVILKLAQTLRRGGTAIIGWRLIAMSLWTALALAARVNT